MLNKNNKSEMEKLIAKIIGHQPSRVAVTTRDHSMFFSVYCGPRYVEYESAPMHHELFAITEDENIKLAVITAFRGSGKSTICTLSYPLWAILGKQQKKFVLILGQTQQKVQQYLMNIKYELESNELLRADLGPFQEERGQWGATALVLPRFGAKIVIASTEQSIRGLRHRQHRPDLIIIDDAEDLTSVKTREGREKTWEWLVGDVLPARDDMKTKIVVVGNLLHEDCLLKRLEIKIANGDISGVYREYPIVDKEGVSLWPGRYPTPESLELKQKEVLDDIAWHREYLLTIISTSERVVHPEWIHRYENLPKEDPQTIAIGVDLAISEKASADCTAMVIGYIYKYGKETEIYIQPHPVNERLTFPAQVDRIKALDAVHGQKCSRVKFYIEDIAYQKALVQLLEQSKYDVEAASMRGSDKAARLRLATPMMKDARVFFPSEGCEELIEQLVGFGKEKYDDLADAFAYLVIKTLETNTPRGSSGLSYRPEWMDKPLPPMTRGFCGSRPYGSYGPL